MQVSFSKKFVRLYHQAPPKIRLAFNQRLKIFFKSPTHPILNNHPLGGILKGYRSINITGDWRALYCQPKPSFIIFEILGTHSQLYK